MFPSAGVLPAGSGATTPHPAGTTPWFASEADFSASYTGPSFVASGAGFDAGSGDAPLGYGTINYFTNPLPAPAEISDFGTELTVPDRGSRFTSYFRTTFEVPDDGNFYINPQIRYILDDGGYVYLDGELILRVNIADSPDDYLRVASGSTGTESHILTADLSLEPGSITGGNDEVNPVIAGTAVVVQKLGRLTPGTHTLAVSLHSASTTSSDALLALQVVAEESNCLISGSFSASSRDFEGTPEDASDDTVDAAIEVTAEGVTSATWTVVGPVGSSVIGQTGGYNAPVSILGIPIAEFSGGAIDFTLADSSNAECVTVVRVTPANIMASNNLAGMNLPVSTSGEVDIPGWNFDSMARSLTLNAPNGGMSSYRVQSEPVDLSGQPSVQFSGNLEVIDGTAGSEAADFFVASLIYDGDTENPVNLITPHDLILVDGVLRADELAPVEGTFNFALNHVIPASVNSVEIVIEGSNNSPLETFQVTGLDFVVIGSALRVQAGEGVLSNQGTDDPGDDTFLTSLTFIPIDLGVSTGWTSDETPASGLYSDPNPVVFGPFAASSSPRAVSFADDLNPSVMVEVMLTPPTPEVNVSDPTNIVRLENGPGFDDDTLTFDLVISGVNGGPGWTVDSDLVIPNSGEFGLVSFTALAPLSVEDLVFNVQDISYPEVVSEATVGITPRFTIGQSDLSGELVDVIADLATPQSQDWSNDPVARTLVLNGSGIGLQNVNSEVLDLSAQGEVHFSALFRAVDTSLTSNFETLDLFRAELVYTIEGVETIVSLVDDYDIGGGEPSTTGTLLGANGPPNGFINGYLGSIGTDLADGRVYATRPADYAAHIDRDEFNINAAPVEAVIENFFPLSAVIPAEAESVSLNILGGGVSSTETFEVSNIRFSTTSSEGDLDRDGIPDEYEIANGLDPSDSLDRDTDLDGDGQSNFNEFIAGTAPNDASSFLGITAFTLDEGIANVSWSSVPGRSYRIEFSTSLVTWNGLAFIFPAEAAPATETSTGDLDLGIISSPEKAFFRIRVIE